jgi:hypothetical protein
LYSLKPAQNKAFTGIVLPKPHSAKEVRIESKIAFRRELRAFWRELRREQLQIKTHWQYTQDELQTDKKVKKGVLL